MVRASFIKSAVKSEDYPKNNLPEVAFAGRSNVGKSSLINSLLGQKNLAHISSTPGCTRAINFFLVENRWVFVDLPGYGYARVAAKIRSEWGPMVETYLKTRDNLRLVVLLVDIRRNPEKEEFDLIEWLKMYSRPFIVVLTKADKVTRMEVERRQREIASILSDLGNGKLFVYSSRTGEGKKKIVQAINQHLK
ncbi:MAG: ribosome biogenesis GTP-binding protein YihA/YsxC [Syntrophales bacterium]|nr:ribosome biogenesis GTP-binding protein YihA/YsxC [Syntrophales bacterium]